MLINFAKLQKRMNRNMEKKYKQLTALFAAASLILCGCKSSDPMEKYYTFEEITSAAGEVSGITIIGCSLDTQEIRIPSAISGKRVIKLGSYKNGDNYIGVFEGCPSTVERIAVPEGVEEIEGETFANSISIESVSLPESLVYLGPSVFYYCEGLTEITIPENITELLGCDFMGCKSLERAYLPVGLKKIGQLSFAECERLDKINIPSNVGNIETYAFSGCTSLSEITMQEGLLSIGEMAFDGCESLTDVTIPDSVETIGRDAFNGCFDIQVYYRGMTYDYTRLYDIYTLEEGEELPLWFTPGSEE